MAQNETTVKVPSGYQGFLEQGSLYRIQDNGSTTVGVSTTHGFYFGDHTFIGVGFGIEGGDGFFAVPIYSAVKYNFTYASQVSPTVQLRLGSYLSDDPGTYADLALGVRFASKRDFAVNIMLTGTFYENMKWTEYEFDPIEEHTVLMDKVLHPSGFGLRVGIEW